ncbi:MAG: host attachment protein [Planctomycetota bacterium]|nr:host attachment protein [Planctomycetota bacterium]
MATTWIVVAESSRARILRTDSAHEPLKEIETLDHPEARMHEQELTSDVSGRRFATAGPKRHGMSDPVRWKDEHAGRFAREVGRHLEQARTKQAFDRLILAAPPKFLGLLRDELAPGTEAVVAHEFDKNWLHDDPQAIRSHLPAYL